MQMRSITANPSQVMVEQLAALDVKYLFYNSGSREARFFDALHVHPDIHGILALHEGTVAAQAGGYTQANLDPAVMVVHLAAGLAQCLGQLINIWSGGLPVVVISFAGDTGSFADRIELDLSHNFGPTSIATPFTKQNWTVIEPEGLPQAIHRALLVAKTPPVGPVHLAVYDRALGSEQITTNIIEGSIPDLHAGYPSDTDVEKIESVLHDAKSPLFYIGNGVWKSGAEDQIIAVAEHFGVPCVSSYVPVGTWERSIATKHPLNCGRLDQVVDVLQPDLIVCIGIHHRGGGRPGDFDVFSKARQVIAIGSDIEHIKNIPYLSMAILADECRTFERLLELASSHSTPNHFDERRAWVIEQAAALHVQRINEVWRTETRPNQIRSWIVAETLDTALERRGGGLVMLEQYAVPWDTVGGYTFSSDTVDRTDTGRNRYIRAAGGSEGYGVGGAVGLKLAAPEKPVVGLIGDGSLLYAESGLWTAAHHGVPVLYIISNNQSYGAVAYSFGSVDGVMKETGEYAGVVLDGIDPVKLAEGVGIEGMHVQEESRLAAAIEHGLNVVERQNRPFLLNIRLPLGLPEGGRAAAQFRLADAMSKTQTRSA